MEKDFKEKLEFLEALVGIINDCEDVELLATALRMSKFKDNVTVTSETKVNVEVPIKEIQYVPTYVPYPTPIDPFNPWYHSTFKIEPFYDTTTSASDTISKKEVLKG